MTARLDADGMLGAVGGTSALEALAAGAPVGDALRSPARQLEGVRRLRSLANAVEEISAATGRPGPDDPSRW